MYRSLAPPHVRPNGSPLANAISSLPDCSLASRVRSAGRHGDGDGDSRPPPGSAHKCSCSFKQSSPHTLAIVADMHERHADET